MTDSKGEILTREEIIWELRRVMGFPDRKAAKCLQVMVRTMRSALESGDEVYVKGLGRLSVITKAGRTYRCRKTGKVVTKKPTQTGTFVLWQGFGR